MTVLAFFFFGRSSIQGTAHGGCSWSAFPTFLVVVYLPRATPGLFQGTKRRPTDHSFAPSVARSRRGRLEGAQRSAKHLKAMPWVVACNQQLSGGSKTHTQGVHAWPSTDLHRQHSAYATAFKPHQWCGLTERELPLRGTLGLRPR